MERVYSYNPRAHMGLLSININFQLKGSVKEPITMKLRKSLVKPVTRKKTCNYIELLGSSTRDRYAWRRI